MIEAEDAPCDISVRLDLVRLLPFVIVQLLLVAQTADVSVKHGR